MTDLRTITEENLIEIIDLEVSKEQEDQVSPNSISIAEGNYRKGAWFKGIYHKETPVGFVMLDINTATKECHLWRYMIAKEHQGKGYGKDAMTQVIAFVKSLSGIDKFLTSYVPKEKDGADGFYKALGFLETGPLEDSTEIGLEYHL
jgi:diamine N-acetyltransferase